MEIVQSGLNFRITNARSGTVLDVASDNISVVGNQWIQGENQSWITTWTGNSWTIRSSLSGLYVGLAGSAADGTRLIVSAAPFQWDIWHDTADPRTYRIFVPNTHFNWDLSSHGSSAPNTPTTVWYTYEDDAVHQTWTFDRV